MNSMPSARLSILPNPVLVDGMELVARPQTERLSIEKLGRDRSSVEAYVRFQQRLWPDRFGADSWEALLLKYFDHPDAECCPGTGVYACMEGDEILGVQAAYPFPVIQSGTLYGGHMLVDWGALALDEKGRGPLLRAAVGGKLFRTLLKLPGRKYGSTGSSDAMKALALRATRIPSTFSIAILSPLRAALFHYASLSWIARPIPICELRKLRSGAVAILSGADLGGFEPTPIEGAVRVHHSREFWRALGNARRTTGAIRLKVGTDYAQAEFILQIKGSGQLRHAVLLSAHFEEEGRREIEKLGRVLREALREWKVCTFFAIEADTRISRLLRALSPWRRHYPSEWWSIATPSDTFAATDVKWWLTGAERDGVWAI